jgi:hypothetical protein
MAEETWSGSDSNWWLSIFPYGEDYKKENGNCKTSLLE